MALDLTSPVYMSDLEEARTSALSVLEDIDSSAEDKEDAESTLEELAAIASEIGLVRYDSLTDSLEDTMADVSMEDADYSTWYDSSDLESALREMYDDNYNIPSAVVDHIDWDSVAREHISECAEFTHDSTTFYAI